MASPLILSGQVKSQLSSYKKVEEVVKIPVDFFFCKVPCPTCTDRNGYMEFNGTVNRSATMKKPLYQHKCNKCGKLYDFDAKYPDIYPEFPPDQVKDNDAEK